jgi:hypothetical protein
MCWRHSRQTARAGTTGAPRDSAGLTSRIWWCSGEGGADERRHVTRAAAAVMTAGSLVLGLALALVVAISNNPALPNGMRWALLLLAFVASILASMQG